jgi:hypothetical protein
MNIAHFVPIGWQTWPPHAILVSDWLNQNLVGSIYMYGRFCIKSDRDEISNLHRGHSIDASYQVSVHLAMRFQRRRFLKISQSETRIACGSHVLTVY